MGTRFEIVIAGNAQSVRPVAEAALREIEDLHARFTRFAPDSLVSHINRNAGRNPVRLDRPTFDLLVAAQQVSAQSNGAFDVALGTGRYDLDWDACTIALESPRVQLDLGAVAKGYALDCAAAILRAGGVRSALLHGGTSSVIALGAPPGAAAWRVALVHRPAHACIDLCGTALSVSRPFSQVAPNGTTHIVDPRTGASIRERRIAVVTGPSAALADAWSTALAVLGTRPAALACEWWTAIELEHD